MEERDERDVNCWGQNTRELTRFADWHHSLLLAVPLLPLSAYLRDRQGDSAGQEGGRMREGWENWAAIVGQGRALTPVLSVWLLDGRVLWWTDCHV